MKLDRNSINARYHRWFYAIEDFRTEPVNGCVYAWQSIQAWVLFIPYCILSLPVVLDELFSKKYENGDHSTMYRVSFSFVIYLLIFLTFCLGSALSLFFTTYATLSFMDTCSFLGIFVWMIIFACFWVYMGEILSEKIKKVKKNIPKTNILIEYFKAKRDKNCPKIEWYTKNK